jgi:hypothetical protein
LNSSKWSASRLPPAAFSDVNARTRLTLGFFLESGRFSPAPVTPGNSPIFAGELRRSRQPDRRVCDPCPDAAKAANDNTKETGPQRPN